MDFPVTLTSIQSSLSCQEESQDQLAFQMTVAWTQQPVCPVYQAKQYESDLGLRGSLIQVCAKEPFPFDSITCPLS
ncbi:hypothetical protein V6Z11_D01G111900 [Gossypium hirsutum]|nr:hypothetical protein ES332_D01G115900v1 [Gossypium tomentosum]